MSQQMYKRTLMGYGLETWVYIAHLNTTYYCFLSGPRMIDLQTTRAGKYPVLVCFNLPHFINKERDLIICSSQSGPFKNHPTSVRHARIYAKEIPHWVTRFSHLHLPCTPVLAPGSQSLLMLHPDAPSDA